MFINAKPVFPAELWGKMNAFAIAKIRIDINENTEIHIAAADFYRLLINGEFVSFGPARTARGYARKDIIPLGKYKAKNAEIAIEIAAYNCRSLSTVKQDGFVQAEIFENGESIAYTGRDFELFIPERKISKTDRYSNQRHFTEVWDFSKMNEIHCENPAILENPPKIIDRVAPYPHYEDISLNEAAIFGKLVYNPDLPVKKSNYSAGGGLSEKDGMEFWGHFDNDEIEHHPYTYIQAFDQIKAAEKIKLPISFSNEDYAIFDFSRIETGFIKICAKALEKSRIIIAFSEAIDEDKFTFVKNMHTYNVIEIALNAGQSIDFASFEPYCMRYCLVTVIGNVCIEGFGIKTFERETNGAYIPENLPKSIEKIYNAAIRTFAHNAVDLYSDCPSRERAGWLCDSYFIAKTEQLLFGKTPVEDAFLENYRLFENMGEVPEGMIHMCYPSDVEPNGNFIPQWSMWYILEVEEYLNIRNKNIDKELFRKSIFGLLEYFEKFENADGLLEKLQKWNFVEWSRANKWTRDINYPTNFLYSAVLEAVYKIYGDEKYLNKAKKIRAKTVEKSYRDGLFYDHSIYDENGVAVLQDDCSEICQYYAVKFGGVDINAPKYSSLKDKILHFFLPKRTELTQEIEPINAFMGIYLRMEILLDMKQFDLLEKELVDFFGAMEETTGTLWENRHKVGSLDHGFASYATVVIDAFMKNK